MKYTNNNKPLVCMMTQSTCYKGTSVMTPKGVLWHSTGANNPWLKRYVQPDDNAADKAKMLALLGKNQYNNDWNHIDRQAGLNAWIGKLADGTVASVQTMPWNYKPWGCGAGSKGSCNNGWMQFEICEDALTDRSYFNAVYNEACELTAYYCTMYGIDPFGTVQYNGVAVPTILCHQDSYKLKLGGNHGDVYHWFNKFGKTMDDVRRDVAKLMGKTVSTQPSNEIDGKYSKGQAVQLSANFKSTEFDCHGKGCCSETLVDQKLVKYLQKIREHFNKPVNISSGYRCEIHNRNVGGATGSRHSKGQAADIYINGVKPAEIAKYAESIGILGIGLYETNKDGHFVHIDTRSTKSFWYGQSEAYRSTFGGTPIKEEEKKEENKIDTSKINTSSADPQVMWNFFKSKGLNDYGIAGLIGNLDYESGLRPTNLEDAYQSKLGYTDAEYTAAVDQGIYTNFVKDSAGYGLAQWTYWTLKQDMLDYFKKAGKSIGDLQTQMEFLAYHLPKKYNAVWEILKTAKSVREASDAVMLRFECPADQSENARAKRASYGQKYYDKYHKSSSVPVKPTEPQNTSSKIEEGDIVTIKKNAVYYNGVSVPTWVMAKEWIVREVNGECAVIDKSADGKNSIKSPIHVKFLEAPSKKTEDKKENVNDLPYKVRVIASALYYRQGPGTNYRANGTIKRNEVYTVVAEQDGWGKLKSGAGWICLQYTEKL